MTSPVRFCVPAGTLTIALSIIAFAPCLLANAPDTPDFPPFDSWRAAALAGDQAALTNLYVASPPAKAMLGKTAIPLADEWRFWTDSRQNQLTDINPKLLSVTSRGDQKQLILRLQARQDGHPVVASMVQVWVHRDFAWRIAVTKRSSFQSDSGTRLSEPVKPNTQLYPDPAEADAELTAALSHAAHENKRVLVVFGANWCYDCHVLDTTFHSPAFAPLVDANYIVLHVNLGDEGKDNHAMAESLGVSLDHGIPSLAILSPDRKVMVAQRNGEFEDTQKIGPDDVRAFLEKWKPVRN